MDLEKLLPLPAVPYDASDKHATRVSSLSLVRYRTNDYSVPVAYGHRDVLVRGYVHEVREYDKLASQCASEGADHPDYLLRLSELELIDRHHRMVERRIKAGGEPARIIDGIGKSS